MESNDKPKEWTFKNQSNGSGYEWVEFYRKGNFVFEYDGDQLKPKEFCDALNQFEDLKKENEELKKRIEKLLFQVAKEEQRTDNSVRF